MFYAPYSVLDTNWKIHVYTVSSILHLQKMVIVLTLSSGSKRGYKRKQEGMCGSKGIATI